MGDPHMSLQARLMSQALREFTGVTHRTGTTLIFINQLRQKMSVVSVPADKASELTCPSWDTDRDIARFVPQLGRPVCSPVDGWGAQIRTRL
jgi:RecA/RadA recombinase